MLTSKLADAKSALCKWTAGTPKKKKKGKKNPSREPKTSRLYSQYADRTWNSLNLNSSREDVWVCALQLQMKQTPTEIISKWYHDQTQTRALCREFLHTNTDFLGIKFQIAFLSVVEILYISKTTKLWKYSDGSKSLALKMLHK